jgi:hypothetical protein
VTTNTATTRRSTRMGLWDGAAAAADHVGRAGRPQLEAGGELQVQQGEGRRRGAHHTAGKRSFLKHQPTQTQSSRLSRMAAASTYSTLT